MSGIHSISPIDGRYARVTHSLQSFYSEAALIRYRIKVEVRYLEALSEESLKGLDANMLKKACEKLKPWSENLKDDEILRVKEIERVTNHDVKAVEYIIKEKLDEWGYSGIKEWVHFGLTSQDINNTSIPWSMKEANEEVLIPKLEEVIAQLMEQ